MSVEFSTDAYIFYM